MKKQLNIPDAPFAKTEKQLGLYPVVDSLQWIERLLKAGVTTLQLRIKDTNCTNIEAQIKNAISLAYKYQARLFINDYWQLAIKYRAYGVHLGQEDIELASLSAIQAAGLRLGISTHDKTELAKAKLLRPSYIALGHIFPTNTKQMSSNPQGLDNLKQQVMLCDDYPTVAIGGISINRVPAVIATGVGSVAVVSAITQAADWQNATAQLLNLIEGKRFTDKSFESDRPKNQQITNQILKNSKQTSSLHIVQKEEI